MIDRPVRYDKENQTVDDKNGKVICIVSWPGIQRTLEVSHAMGQEIVDALNNENAVIVVPAAGNGGEKKRAGNPNFHKGQANPYK